MILSHILMCSEYAMIHAVDSRFRSTLFGSGRIHVRCLPCKPSGRMGDKTKSKLKQKAAVYWTKAKWARVMPVILRSSCQRQNKMVATGHHSFLPYCPADGHHVLFLVWALLLQLLGHQKISVTLSYGLHLCQLAQELRRTDQGTVHRKQLELFVSWPRTWILWGNPVASKDVWNTTDHSITQKHHRDVEEKKVSVKHRREELDLQQCQDMAVWQNQTFLLKVNLYSVHYCSIYVSQSVLMNTWYWGRREAGGRSTV